MARVNLRTVQELMGHTTIAMTVRYSHLSLRISSSCPASAPTAPLPARASLLPRRQPRGHPTSSTAQQFRERATGVEPATASLGSWSTKGRKTMIPGH